MTDEARALLSQVVREHGIHAGSGHAGTLQRLQSLKRLGLVYREQRPGGKWFATEAGRAALGRDGGDA